MASALHPENERLAQMIRDLENGARVIEAIEAGAPYPSCVLELPADRVRELEEGLGVGTGGHLRDA